MIREVNRSTKHADAWQRVRAELTLFSCDAAHLRKGPGISSNTDAIWVYWSSDLDHWNSAQKAIVLDGAGSSWSHTILGLPSVVPQGHRLAIYYDGLAESGLTHMRRDIGLAWVDLPLRIPEERERCQPFISA